MPWLLIVGATSDMARALAREYASRGWNLYLAARRPEDLIPLARDLGLRFGVKTKTLELDITAYYTFASFYSSLDPKPLGVAVFVGYLPDQTLAQSRMDETIKTIRVNYEGPVCLLNLIASDMEKRGEGFIIGVSSVAGDRGRPSNYIYGSAKAGFTAYLSGLRARLHRRGVHVLTVKPGFVRTKMTERMKLPRLLTASPERVARDIYRAQQARKNVLYTPWFWRWIMLAVRLIPERIFKTMDF